MKWGYRNMSKPEKCPECGFLYFDLEDHISKEHPDVETKGTFSIKSPWPQPTLLTRRKIVSLIEEGNHDEALEILHRFYETPRSIRVITPRQALKSTDPCIIDQVPHLFVFDFIEWKKLKEDFPSEYKKFEKTLRKYLPPEIKISEFLGAGAGKRVGWFLIATEDRKCPDFIVSSEKHLYNPALTIHEFHHLLWGYLDVKQAPDFGAASLSLPETWDKWTRDFFTGITLSNETGVS